MHCSFYIENTSFFRYPHRPAPGRLPAKGPDPGNFFPVRRQGWVIIIHMGQAIIHMGQALAGGHCQRHPVSARSRRPVWRTCSEPARPESALFCTGTGHLGQRTVLRMWKQHVINPVIGSGRGTRDSGAGRWTAAPAGEILLMQNDSPRVRHRGRLPAVGSVCRYHGLRGKGMLVEPGLQGPGRVAACGAGPEPVSGPAGPGAVIPFPHAQRGYHA